MLNSICPIFASVCVRTSVGQCGNQIGGRFWDLVLHEHARYNKAGLYDDAMSSFFRHVDTKQGQQNISVLQNGAERIRGLRARSLMVDMEEGVINQILRSPLCEIYDDNQIVSSVSGSGNNWSVGYHIYGTQYEEQLLEALRIQAEYCDSLQSFFMIYSMGGGTGSGLGSFILDMLEDSYPSVYRFVNATVPSPDDDVVTSPYNSILSLHHMTQSADCVLPVDNQSLIGIYERIMGKSDSGLQARKAGSAITDNIAVDARTGALTAIPMTSSNILQGRTLAFDTMNNIVANLLLNMTSSMRFEGTMNVDISDIVTNLVPFPRLKYLFSSMTPLYTLADSRMPPRRLDQMFVDAFARESQLVCAEPRNSVYLANALIVRGSVEVSDIRRNIDKMRKTLRFASWSAESWKTGLCDYPPIGQPHSLLCLANNCCMRTVVGRIGERFTKLYRRKANLHHYLDNMDANEFVEARESMRSLLDEYSALDKPVDSALRYQKPL